MIPNSNLSILPWYKTLDAQNARKWWIYGNVYPLFVRSGTLAPFQILRDHRTGTSITEFKIYTANGDYVGDYTTVMRGGGLTVVPFAAENYDVIVYTATVPTVNLDNGQYYAKLSDRFNTWFSDVFTVINDVEPYLKIEWWDDEDFIMEGSRIVYESPSFKNVLYLASDLAKPEYPFEEEVEERDGLFFPIKQISEKRYRFNFLAPEYLLDVIRFIRLSDYIRVTYHGITYNVDSFLMSPEWESNGDLAVVAAEFDTAVIAKKIGVGVGGAPITQHGDFNDDFNSDFNIQ